jgi:hypothetical protein
VAQQDLTPIVTTSALSQDGDHGAKKRKPGCC